MEQGLLAIILHAHLPYVRHPEYPEFLEEDWLFEAISETYLPLLQVFEGCLQDGVRARVTLGLTPPLCEMLADPLLQDRYVRHLNKLIELCEKEVVRTQDSQAMNATAHMYLNHFTVARQMFEDRYQRNILNGFRALRHRDEKRIVAAVFRDLLDRFHEVDDFRRFPSLLLLNGLNG